MLRENYLFIITNWQDLDSTMSLYYTELLMSRNLSKAADQPDNKEHCAPRPQLRRHGSSRALGVTGVGLSTLGGQESGTFHIQCCTGLCCILPKMLAGPAAVWMCP